MSIQKEKKKPVYILFLVLKKTNKDENSNGKQPLQIYHTEAEI